VGQDPEEAEREEVMPGGRWRDEALPAAAMDAARAVIDRSRRGTGGAFLREGGAWGQGSWDLGNPLFAARGWSCDRKFRSRTLVNLDFRGRKMHKYASRSIGARLVNHDVWLMGATHPINSPYTNCFEMTKASFGTQERENIGTGNI
jgi:hypothetical protein